MADLLNGLWTLGGPDDKRFMKIVFFPELCTLRIPDHFVEKHFQNWPSNVILSAGDGLSWPTKVVSDAGGVRLTEGWGLFRDTYKFKKEDVLIFTYVSRHHFLVTIFDGITCCERPLLPLVDGFIYAEESDENTNNGDQQGVEQTNDIATAEEIDTLLVLDEHEKAAKACKERSDDERRKAALRLSEESARIECSQVKATDQREARIKEMRKWADKDRTASLKRKRSCTPKKDTSSSETDGSRQLQRGVKHSSNGKARSASRRRIAPYFESDGEADHSVRRREHRRHGDVYPKGDKNAESSRMAQLRGILTCPTTGNGSRKEGRVHFTSKSKSRHHGNDENRRGLGRNKKSCGKGPSSAINGAKPRCPGNMKRVWESSTDSGEYVHEASSDDNQISIFIRPTATASDGVLNLPTYWARDNLKFGTNKRMLRIMGKRGYWRVKCHLSNTGAHIGKGWSTFCKDNKLAPDDSCTFDPLDVDQTTWFVRILRAG